MLTRQLMIGPWAGMPVAWDSQFRFDEQVYRQDIARICRAGVPGVYTAGTTGEFYAMEYDEWQAVTRATVDECKAQDTPVMIGITATYTLGAQRRAAFAAECGADAVQVALPYWMEMDDRDVVSFFVSVAKTCPQLAFTIYETKRAKKILTVEQHRAIFEESATYLAVKANAGTIGREPEACRQLSEFVNVWVSETAWADLGPYGANGCASALVYVNPRVILHMFDLLMKQQWQELQPLIDMVSLLTTEGLKPYIERGCTDTAFDHLMGVASGFLRMNVRTRGTYPSATDEDVAALRAWMREHTPAMLVG